MEQEEQQQNLSSSNASSKTRFRKEHECFLCPFREQGKKPQLSESDIAEASQKLEEIKKRFSSIGHVRAPRARRPLLNWDQIKLLSDELFNREQMTFRLICSRCIKKQFALSHYKYMLVVRYAAAAADQQHDSRVLSKKKKRAVVTPEIIKETHRFIRENTNYDDARKKFSFKEQHCATINTTLGLDDHLEELPQFSIDRLYTFYKLFLSSSYLVDSGGNCFSTVGRTAFFNIFNNHREYRPLLTEDDTQPIHRQQSSSGDHTSAAKTSSLLQPPLQPPPHQQHYEQPQNSQLCDILTAVLRKKKKPFPSAATTKEVPIRKRYRKKKRLLRSGYLTKN